MDRIILITVALISFTICHQCCAQSMYSNTHPEWSPNGNKIAFTTNRDGNIEIYVVDADGENEKRLTNHDQVDAELSWSPDGSKIAFNAREKEGGDFEIYVMNVDGSERKQLTFNDAGDYTPTWDPSGRKILFSSNRDYPEATDMEGNRELYTMNIDGSQVERITDFGAKTSTPVYSKNGKKIAFTSDKDGDYEIYIMSADGSSVEQHTFNDQFDWYPRWTKKGNLTYTSGTWEPYSWKLMELNFKGKYSTIVESADSGNGSWSPDFKKLVFGKYVDGNSVLYLLDERDDSIKKLQR